MRPARVSIDRVSVILPPGARAADAERTLREALALLGIRLADAPLERPGHAGEPLRLDTLTAEWPDGPGAAVRLADELYERVARRTE